jgi:hypothetical protein
LGDIEVEDPDSTVTHPDPIVSLEIPLIQKIIQDETWLEGERRGCSVVSADPVVQEHVCEVILRVGQELRMSLMRQAESISGPAILSLRVLDDERAA